MGKRAERGNGVRRGIPEELGDGFDWRRLGAAWATASKATPAVVTVPANVSQQDSQVIRSNLFHPLPPLGEEEIHGIHVTKPPFDSCFYIRTTYIPASLSSI